MAEKKRTEVAPLPPGQASQAPNLERLMRFIENLLGIDGLAAPENRVPAIWGLAIALVAMLLRVIFWVYTQRYWEDALISCLHSENFVLGFGMTHVRPGEPPLHGFTSPLSVLIPLIGDLMHVGWGVDFIKLASIPAAAVTVLYLVGCGIHPSVRLATPLIVMLAGYAAFEHHQIMFGMSGMETQFAVLSIVASLYHAIAWHPRRLGIWLGVCMLARPDFAIWCAIIGVYGLFREPRRMPLIIGLALAVYLPWMAFTLYEYGSPIPNTIIAKSLGYTIWYQQYDDRSLPFVLQALWDVFTITVNIDLAPSFAGHSSMAVPLLFPIGQVSPIATFVFGVSMLGVVFIIAQRHYAMWPLAAGAIAFTLFFIFCVGLMFAWYRPAYNIMLVFLAAWAIHCGAQFIRKAPVRARVLNTVTFLYLAMFVGMLPFTFYAEHQIQKYVENGVRKQAGLFLRDRMKPDEAVGCEPLGYMGYYSRGNVYDWPGLNSRKVVAWSRSHPREERKLENMLKDLQPEYLFLRDLEILNFKNRDWFVAHYHPLKQFKVADEDVARIPFADHSPDLSFWIYQKNPLAAASTP